ncbi:MAG: tRNA (guanosine(46)-N7)-methyltransferase TrmB [Acidobacteria bacterium]|nr:tRNA (guanosine(46)-N7)-methyltransferase TrmB [Acidobacteriota bacterium]
MRGLGACRSELLATLKSRSDWEVELGFGKGRYLLGSASAMPGRPFLGVEIVSKYFRLAVRRAAARRLDNLILLRGEALYLISTLLPEAMARTVHIYFPDPWPKSRHHRRRLLDPRTVDLVLSLLEPSSGRLCFATDHDEYGEAVVETLERHPAVEVERLVGGWPEGPRTNYEAKFEARGRHILRLMAGLRPGAASLLHPAGRDAILVAPAAADQPASSSRTSS